ncbi:MAG: aminoglycoside phosphotransferase family protein [Thermomicrobiales bacterium]
MSTDIPLRDGVVLPGTMVDSMLGLADTRYTPAWFDALPAMVAAWCERWGITLVPEIPTLTYTVVLFGHSASEGEVVLKLAPAEMEFDAEIAGLARLQGPGVVRLIHADPVAAGMLMERVRPGTPLRAFDDRIDDVTATTIGARMLRRIWKDAPDAPGNLIPLQRWFRDLFRIHDQLRGGRVDLPYSAASVAFAIECANALLATTNPVVLHGDMHHGNILENEAGDWTVIDPKGLIGDRAYDVGTWMLNGWPDNEPGDAASIVRRRVETFAQELALSREQVLIGVIVHCALCAAWSTVDTTPEQQEADRWLANTLRTWEIAERMADEAGMRR